MVKKLDLSKKIDSSVQCVSFGNYCAPNDEIRENFNGYRVIEIDLF